MLDLLKLVNDLSDIKVAIIGDVGVDQFVYGTSDRICPEAPVPIFIEQENEFVPGLAANVAANVKSLGGIPFLIGVTGEDETRLELEECLSSRGISCENLISDLQRHTTLKKRLVVDRRHLVVRVDRESKDEVTQACEMGIYQKFLAVLDEVDIVVMSDYGKGVLSKRLIDGIVREAKNRHKITICDPKPNGQNTLKYSNVDFLTPNKKEAQVMYEELVGRSESDPFLLGKEIHNCLLNKSVLITLGAQGIFVTNENEAMTVPAVEQKVYDVCGAGDTVVATLALALGSGTAILDAARLANFAASIAISRFGTTAITNEELYSGISNT